MTADLPNLMRTLAARMESYADNDLDTYTDLEARARFSLAEGKQLADGYLLDGLDLYDPASQSIFAIALLRSEYGEAIGDEDLILGSKALVCASRLYIRNPNDGESPS